MSVFNIFATDDAFTLASVNLHRNGATQFALNGATKFAP